MSSTAASAVATVQPASGPTLDVEFTTKDLPLAALLKKIHVEHGKSPYALGWDMAKRVYGSRKLLPEEYMQLRMFDDTGRSPADKDAFVGRILRRKIAGAFNPNRAWDAVTDDKLVTEFVLRGMGFPIVRTVALFGSRSNVPSLTRLATADDLASFLRQAAYPLFGKPIGESLSLGTVGLERCEADGDRLHLLNGKTTAVDTFVAEVTKTYRSGYLFQPLLRSHPAVADVIGRVVSCVRFYTLATSGRAEVLRQVWKLPAGGSMADNFWRGNLLAQIDPSTGQVVRAVRGHGVAQQVLDRHPDTGQDLGRLIVPDWAATTGMVLQAAEALSAVRLLGWDVAITDAGPVVVEINNCPDFMLVQMAEGRGIADARLMALYEEAVAINRKTAKTSGSWRDGARRAAAKFATATNVNAKIG